MASTLREGVTNPSLLIVVFVSTIPVQFSSVTTDAASNNASSIKSGDTFNKSGFGPLALFTS